jgi:hypothetical protein
MKMTMKAANETVANCSREGGEMPPTGVFVGTLATIGVLGAALNVIVISSVWGNAR